MDLSPSLIRRIETAAGQPIRQDRRLAGGCIGDVRRFDFDGGTAMVAKLGHADSGLALEGRMLEFLRRESSLPVPGVILAEDDLLLMDLLPAGGALDGSAERHAADLIADLHGITGEHFGFAYDTVIGGLPQANPEMPSWVEFFRDHRLLAMADQAVQAGRLPSAARHQIDRLAARLGEWVDEPAAPALLHGDLWGGNILSRDGRITGFIDPAIYFGDPDIELAFATLFNTFGDSFFARYQEHRNLAPGFFEVRRDLYNLYPLLVHVRLFGGSYVNAVTQTLRRFGC